MSGTNDPCLGPMEKGPESITDLVPDYVWYQCFMSDTSDLCLAPLILMSDTFANAHYHTAA